MSKKSKQKHLKIKCVPKSYFKKMLKLDTRAVSKRLNVLLERLIDENGEIHPSFQITEKPTLSVAPYETSPRIYEKGINSLSIAKEKLEEREKKSIPEMEIINQIFYDDFHKKGMSC